MAQEMTVSFEDYLALVTAAELAEPLGEWAWLPISEVRPVALSLFGDVYLVDRPGQIFVLDTSFGVVELVATSNDDLVRRLNTDHEFAARLLRMELAHALWATAARAGRGQVFGFAIPLILGGRADPSNVAIVDHRAMLSMLAQLTQGVSRLAVGERFRISFEGFPEPHPPTDPQGHAIRAARDRASLARSVS